MRFGKRYWRWKRDVWEAKSAEGKELINKESGKGNTQICSRIELRTQIDVRDKGQNDVAHRYPNKFYAKKKIGALSHITPLLCGEDRAPSDKHNHTKTGKKTQNKKNKMAREEQMMISWRKEEDKKQVCTSEKSKHHRREGNRKAKRAKRDMPSYSITLNWS